MKYWKEIAGIVLIVAGFFMALNDDSSQFVEIVGWVIIGVAVLAWVWAWRTQNQQRGQ